jgi:hypothetical protein
VDSQLRWARSGNFPVLKFKFGKDLSAEQPHCDGTSKTTP